MIRAVGIDRADAAIARARIGFQTSRELVGRLVEDLVHHGARHAL